MQPEIFTKKVENCKCEVCGTWNLIVTFINDLEVSGECKACGEGWIDECYEEINPCVFRKIK